MFWRTTNVICVFGESRAENSVLNDQLRADIKDYGILLLEIISGQSRRLFVKDGKSLVDWVRFLISNMFCNCLSPNHQSSRGATIGLKWVLFCTRHVGLTQSTYRPKKSFKWFYALKYTLGNFRLI